MSTNGAAGANPGQAQAVAEPRRVLFIVFAVVGVVVLCVLALPGGSTTSNGAVSANELTQSGISKHGGGTRGGAGHGSAASKPTPVSHDVGTSSTPPPTTPEADGGADTGADVDTASDAESGSDNHPISGVVDMDSGRKISKKAKGGIKHRIPVTRNKIPREAGAHWCPEQLRRDYGHRHGSESWEDGGLKQQNSAVFKAAARLAASDPSLRSARDFKSLAGEEVWCLQRFYGSPIRKGLTYVELGAVDGVKFSNTIVLEKHLGWKGMLIEASPQNYKRLPKNRPGATTFHGAVCEVPGQLKFYGRGPGASMAYEDDTVEFQVPCQPMKAYEAEAGVTDIAFFVIDVEGAEQVVVETHDWGEVPASVVVVEASWEDIDWEKNRGVRLALSSRGMCMLAQDVGHGNEVWVNEWWWTHADDPVMDWPPNAPQRAQIKSAVAATLESRPGVVQG